MYIYIYMLKYNNDTGARTPNSCSQFYLRLLQATWRQPRPKAHRRPFPITEIRTLKCKHCLGKTMLVTVPESNEFIRNCISWGRRRKKHEHRLVEISGNNQKRQYTKGCYSLMWLIFVFAFQYFSCLDVLHLSSKSFPSAEIICVLSFVVFRIVILVFECFKV